MAKTVTAAEMKERERAANEAGLLYIQLMENAGRAAYAELKQRVQVRVLLAEGEPKTADAKTNLARLAETAAEVVRDTEQAAFGADAVVDALYGTGFHGELRPGGAAACALMGRERERGAFVLALDLPSGVSADSGEVAAGAVQADATVTFDCTKPLHFAKVSKPFCGALVCADIGIGKALGEHET